MSHSNVRDAIMANKLKEGIRDSIVYLRMLEGAKLPGVYERKRKQLLESLLDLEGDSRKDQPPKFEDDAESLTSQGSPQKKSSSVEKEEDADGSEGANKSRVMGSVSKFEVKPAPSKFKYRTLEELKELKKKRESGIVEDIEPPKETAEQPQQTTPAASKPETKKVNAVAKKVEKEPPPPPEEDDDLYDDTVAFQAEHQQQEEEKQDTEELEEKKPRSNSKGGSGLMKRLFNKKDKASKISSITESVSSETLDDPEADSTNDIKADTTSIEELAPEDEEEMEGFHLASQLEKVTKGRFGKYHYQSYKAELNNDQVILTRPKDKEPTIISLVGAATAVRDVYQFELHTDDKSFTFKTDSEDMTIKWAETLKAAIDACTPVEPIEEEPEEEEEESGVPQITVSSENLDEPADKENYINYVFSKKKKPEMPDLSTVIIRGFLYRKAKFGWDRVWVCLTEDNALFLAANDTTKKVMHSLQVTEGVKIEVKKGSDKYPHCMLVTGGKFKEMLATDVKIEYDTWKLCLEQAAGGGGGIQELLSEDEDGGELYEPLEDTARPYIPSSPRPTGAPPTVSSLPRPTGAPPTIPLPTTNDDVYEVGDDIYEGLEDIDLPPTPQLSTRPPPTATVNKSPSLPPRNEPTPSLPPRNEPYKKDTPAALPPPRPAKNIPSETTGELEELYDDVVNAMAEEENYDDVAVEADMEDTYDDVETARSTAATSTVLTRQDSGGELYEDMEPQAAGYVALEPRDRGQEEPEEYLEVDTGKGEALDDDFYVEVDQPPPRPPPPSKQVSSPPATTTTTTTIPKPSPPKCASASTTPASKPKVNSLNRTRPSSAPKGASKVAALSKMFGSTEEATPSSSTKVVKKGSHSGSLLYKSPSKKAFASEWCVLENTVIIFYSSPTDKLSHYRLNVKDATLKLGSSDGKNTSNFAFHINKMGVSHQFSASTFQEMAEWVGALTGVLKVSPNAEHLYKAVQSYSSTKDGHASFKEGAVLWVLGSESPTLLMGMVGTSPNDFTNTWGLFPSNNVEALTQEDVYI